jgi:hypothetical protein
MRLLISFFSFLLLCSCASSSNQAWHTLDFEAFKLKAPHNWESYKLKGIDSYVGGLTNGKDSLEFDYGWYSAEVGDEDASKHLFAQDTVNGILASIVIPKLETDGCVRMSMKVTKKNKFSIGGCNVKHTDTILKMFKSIVFSVSDTTKNGNLTKEKFIAGSNGSGKTIYQSNCASCHSFTKYLIGPALTPVFEIRNKKWLKLFLTDKSTILKDTSYLNSRKRYEGVVCPDFPNLTNGEIDMLLSYFSSYN